MVAGGRLGTTGTLTQTKTGVTTKPTALLVMPQAEVLMASLITAVHFRIQMGDLKVIKAIGSLPQARDMGTGFFESRLIDSVIKW
jgi:hypothetical protein